MASSSLHFPYQQPSFGNLARKSPPRPVLQTGSFAYWMVPTTVLPESLLKITKCTTKLFSLSWSTGTTFYIAYLHIFQPFFKSWLEKTGLPSLILLLKSSGNCSPRPVTEKDFFFFICKSSMVPLGHSHQCTAMVKQLLTMSAQPPRQYGLAFYTARGIKNKKTPNNDVKTITPERQANL